MSGSYLTFSAYLDASGLERKAGCCIGIESQLPETYKDTRHSYRDVDAPNGPEQDGSKDTYFTPAMPLTGGQSRMQSLIRLSRLVLILLHGTIEFYVLNQQGS